MYCLQEVEKRLKVLLMRKFCLQTSICYLKQPYKVLQIVLCWKHFVRSAHTYLFLQTKIIRKCFEYKLKVMCLSSIGFCTLVCTLSLFPEIPAYTFMLPSSILHALVFIIFKAEHQSSRMERDFSETICGCIWAPLSFYYSFYQLN